MRVPVLSIGQNPIWDRIIDGMRRVAPTLGIEIESVKAAGPSQIDEALNTVMGRQADALYVFEAPVLRDNSSQVIPFAAKRGIPSIYGGADFVRNGGLISYGASFDDLFRRAASYVVKILDGAKPAELPVQQPTKYELAVNLTTIPELSIEERAAVSGGNSPPPPEAIKIATPTWKYLTPTSPASEASLAAAIAAGYTVENVG